MNPMASTLASVFTSVFKISKAIHKYTGVVFLLYFVLVGITGILINHPSLIRSFSVSAFLLPEGYRFRDWNRMSLREAVYSGTTTDTLYIAGKAGVWQSRDGGKTFAGMVQGFPESAYNRDPRALLLVEKDGGSRLFAGTSSGLYFCNPEKGEWRAVDHENLREEEIVDLIQIKETVYAFTAHAGYAAHINQAMPRFQKVELATATPPPQQIPMYRFLLKLHDGSVLGLPGRLFADMIGVVFVFMSISGLYVWYAPWSRKRFENRPKLRGSRFFYTYHLILGIYAAFFLAVIALTGMFVRPPLLLTIISAKVPSWLYQDPEAESGWPFRIQRAAYLKDENVILLATENGFFKGPADGSAPFEEAQINVPVHGMGAFVLEPTENRQLLIGSFSGIYLWDLATQTGTDLNHKPLPKGRQAKGGQPNSMAAGVGVCRGNPVFWADYRGGIHSLGSYGITPPQMPEEIKNSFMSLWHFLFECHNGRIFRDILGEYTWMFVTLGGAILLISIVTGSYDWLYRKVSAKGEK
jgi:hypothetical protein